MTSYERTLILDCLQARAEELTMEAQEHETVTLRVQLMDQARTIWELRDKLAKEEGGK